MNKYFIFLIFTIGLHADFTWEGKEYHAHSLSQQNAAFEVLKEVSLQGNEAVLDVGCGDGKITRKLSEMVPDGYVVGLDLSPSQIGFARQFQQDNLSFVVGNITELPYDGQFDVVTAFTAMQWVPDQVKGFQEIRYALKENGKLIITVPTGITWQLSEAVRDVIEKEEWSQLPFKDKQHFFLREIYAAHLRQAGFSIDSFKILPSYNLFANRDAFTHFVKQWLPFVQDVPPELRDEFMRQVTDKYLELLPPQSSGEVFFEKYVYNIVATAS